MKDLSLLVWITQLGLSIALPPVGFVLLAKWLMDRFSWGSWTLWTGIVLGVLSAIEGFRSCIKAMTRLSKANKKPEADPPVSFNDHD